ncbi:hypothetical protein Leryth_024876 [Lithospermum erythrorhizon]|nr:hypothetical protein Leryth_024876 [Lithospermum erythrorhizon]
MPLRYYLCLGWSRGLQKLHGALKRTLSILKQEERNISPRMHGKLGLGKIGSYQVVFGVLLK